MSWVFFITPEGKLPEGIKQTLMQVFPTFAGKKAGVQYCKNTGAATTHSALFGEVLQTVRIVRPRYLDYGERSGDIQGILGGNTRR
jgi:hypothetical protein